MIMEFMHPAIHRLSRHLMQFSAWLYAALCRGLARFKVWAGIQARRHPGGTGSLILHVGVLIWVIGVLPVFEKERLPLTRVITVDILPVTGVTNVKPAPPEKVKKSAPVPKEPAPKAEPLPVSPVKAPKMKPAVPVKPVMVKPVARPKIQVKTKPKAKPEPVVKDAAKPEAKSPAFDPNIPLSMSEIDAIRSQLMANWSIIAGGKEAGQIVVTVYISLNMDGSVKEVTVTDAARYASDTRFRAAADGAIRAVRNASPLQGLPKEKYSQWAELEIDFDPQEMMF